MRSAWRLSYSSRGRNLILEKRRSSLERREEKLRSTNMSQIDSNHLFCPKNRILRSLLGNLGSATWPCALRRLCPAVPTRHTLQWNPSDIVLSHDSISETWNLCQQAHAKQGKFFGEFVTVQEGVDRIDRASPKTCKLTDCRVLRGRSSGYQIWKRAQRNSRSDLRPKSRWIEDIE